MSFRGLTFSCFEKECKPLNNKINITVANCKVRKVSFILVVFEDLDCIFDSSCNHLIFLCTIHFFFLFENQKFCLVSFLALLLMFWMDTILGLVAFFLKEAE